MIRFDFALAPARYVFQTAFNLGWPENRAELIVFLQLNLRSPVVAPDVVGYLIALARFSAVVGRSFLRDAGQRTRGERRSARSAQSQREEKMSPSGIGARGRGTGSG